MQACALLLRAAALGIRSNDMSSREPVSATYILPIRAPDAKQATELAAYLRSLPCEQIVVVDASSEAVFEALAAVLPRNVEHVRPDRWSRGLNGKVRGVLAGIARARYERVIVADDDVRYNATALNRALSELDRAEIVRVQNYFDPLPWHALLDTARTLVNRSLDGDWPGTLLFKRSWLPQGYNPDVLFENLELVRTIVARGGRERVARDIYVRRLPPSARHFLSQRVRQAYDEFARPARLTAALTVLPLLAGGAAFGSALPACALILGVTALAAGGWLRDGGYRYFPAAAVAAAPVWMLERAICSWLALYERLRYGGVRYGASIIRTAASPRNRLGARWAA